jgi:predicted transcriptional regulator
MKKGIKISKEYTILGFASFPVIVGEAMKNALEEKGYIEKSKDSEIYYNFTKKGAKDFVETLSN